MQAKESFLETFTMQGLDGDTEREYREGVHLINSLNRI